MGKKTIFSERLKKLIKERGVTQASVADEIGILKQSMSYYITANRPPSIETLKKLCEYFDVSADYLIGTNSEIEFLSNKIDELEKKLQAIKNMIDSKE